MSGVRVVAFGPQRPWVFPGEAVACRAVVAAPEGLPLEARLMLLDLDRVVAEDRGTVQATPAGREVHLRVRLPEAPRHGYGLRLEVGAGEGLVHATAAVEALEGWWQSPRHAAITGYEESSATAEATARLVGWNVNVVQHYDWMWRHYRYRPPDGAVVFEDALGRTVSHDAVRASIDAGHEAGIASLAYGAVYGAEPEHVERHPEDRVFDEDGEPLSLGDAFYINDVRPGTAWRRRLLAEYACAIDDFGFDGIHMDTYGPPHSGIASDGEPVDFARLYPGLIEEAEALVRERAAGTRVLFNCVDGFPLEAVAPAPAAALYLELWPPDDSLADVVRWIDQARGLAAGRQVIIAAYAATLKDLPDPARRDEAFEAVLLLGSVIAAASAHHHTLAEDDRLLVEGYYPAAVPMTPTESAEMRALWRFCARYAHLLSDPELEPVEPAGLVLRDAEGRMVDWTSEPSAGSLWARVMRAAGGRRVLHLVDLRDQADASWTAPKVVAQEVYGLRVGWEGVEAAVVASPWSADGNAAPLGHPADATLPPFRRWLVVAER